MSRLPYDPMLDPVRETNGLGVAGFVCSIIGLLTGGLLCPMGLLISLIALGRRPKGFAIAGVIIGLLGTCGGVILLVIACLAVLGMLGMVAMAVLASDPERLEVTSDMVAMTVVVQQYRNERGDLPEDLDAVELDDLRRMDPWGNAYSYRLLPRTEMGYDIVSAGKDGQFDTEDDLMLTKLDELWANALTDLDKKMKKLESGGDVVIRFEEGEDDSTAADSEEAEAVEGSPDEDKGEDAGEGESGDADDGG